MAIAGRDLDVSERKVCFQWSNQFGGQSLATNGGIVIASGSTLFMFSVPFPCTIQSGAVYAQGVSAAAQIGLFVQRFVAGATTYAVGISNMVLTAFGTSGMQGFSGLAPAGSTLLNLLTNDVMVLQTSVSNSAVSQLIFELIVKKTQDIVSYNNVST
jgi:hypothetical protein